MIENMIEIKDRFLNKVIFKTKKKITFEGFIIELLKKGASLSGADFSGVDLSGVDLSRADLSRASLSGADLSGANLSRANLSGANLSGADLSGANLSGANLSGADLEVRNLPINSKDFISEILYRNAKTENQFDFAARIKLQIECRYDWKFFIKLGEKKRVLDWAKSIFSKWAEFKEKLKKELHD